MNYAIIYNNLVKSRLLIKNERLKKRKNKSEYFEAHHIIPKCKGGNNKQDNIVLFTPKEHYIAHLLLVELYTEDNKMRFALWNMINGRGKNRHSSRKYSKSRYECIIMLKNHLRLINDSRPKGYKPKELSMKGLNHTSQSKINISNSIKGVWNDNEKGNKMREAMKNRKRTKCPFCGIESNISNIKRHVKIKH